MKLNLDLLFAYLDRYPGSLDDYKKVLENEDVIKRKHCHRKRLLVEIGQVPCCTYFLEEGFATGYYLEEGQLAVSWFMTPGKAIIPVNFFSRRPCPERIVLSPGSTYLETTWQDSKYLLKRYPKIEIKVRLIQEEYHRENEEEKRILRKLSAKDKYRYLLAIRPEVKRYASGRDIASYLGITPKTFYQIRKQA